MLRLSDTRIKMLKQESSEFKVYNKKYYTEIEYKHYRIQNTK